MDVSRTELAQPSSADDGPGQAPLSGSSRLRSVSRLDRLLQRWLMIIHGHPIYAHGVVGGLLAALANVLIFGQLGARISIGELVATESAIAFAGFSIPVAITAICLRSEIAAILHVVTEQPVSGLPMSRALTAHHLRQ